MTVKHEGVCLVNRTAWKWNYVVFWIHKAFAERLTVTGRGTRLCFTSIWYAFIKWKPNVCKWWITWLRSLAYVSQDLINAFPSPALCNKQHERERDGGKKAHLTLNSRVFICMALDKLCKLKGKKKWGIMMESRMKIITPVLHKTWWKHDCVHSKQPKGNFWWCPLLLRNSLSPSL